MEKAPIDLKSLLKNVSGPTLDLYYQNIGAEGALYLYKQLRYRTLITHLDLFRNNLQDEGARHIARLLKKSVSIASLNLSSNGIGPDGIGYIIQALKSNKSLKELDLFNNKLNIRSLMDLSDALRENHSLNKLNLGRCPLDMEFCFWIANIAETSPALESLNLSYCQLQNDTQIFEALPKSRIKHLYLSSNMLSFHAIKTLTTHVIDSKIETLFLDSNTICESSVPYVLEMMKSSKTCKRIHLQNCKITMHSMVRIAEILKTNTVITDLNLCGNELGESATLALSDALIHNHSLIKLDITSCKITLKGIMALAYALYYNTKLKELYMNGMDLVLEDPSSFLEKIKMNYTLRTLDTNCLPKDMHGLLMKILERNRLHASHPTDYAYEIKRSIFYTEDLTLVRDKPITKLILSHLSVNTFPKEIFELHHLETLDLRGNQLDILPYEIGTLKHLKELFLSNNHLHFLPFSLIHLPRFKTLMIHGNPLSLIPKHFVIPEEWIEKPFQLTSLYRYLQSISTTVDNEEEPFYHVKLMIVGDENVGKTSVVHNLFSKKKSGAKLKKHSIATDGIDIKEHVHKYKDGMKEFNVTWNIWDFAGQSVYYTTHQFFLSPNTVYLVCYNAESCDESQIARIEFWIKSIQTRAGQVNTYIFLVGTHSDQITSEDKANSVKKLQHVLEHTIVLNLLFVSNKKLEGFKDLRRCIVDAAVKFKLIGNPFPKSVNEVVRHLKSLKEPFITKYALKALLTGLSIPKEKIHRILKFLIQIGSINHFDEDDMLRDIVFIRPQFLCDTFSDLITVRHNLIKNGILQADKAATIWQKDRLEYTTSFLLALYEKFDIAVKLKEDQYLLPSLLSDEKLDSFKFFSRKATYYRLVKNPKEYYRIYHFKFLPFGLFPRLMARCFRNMNYTVINHWKSGFVLESFNEKAELTFDDHNYRLNIKILGTCPSLLLVSIIHCVEDLIKGWYWNAEYQVFIAVQRGHNIAYIDHKEVLLALSRGSHHVAVENRYTKRIDEIAPDLSLHGSYKYRINPKDIKMVKTIGKGGYGEVYLAHYKGEVVAVKSYDVKNKVHSRSDFETEEDYIKFQEDKILTAHQDLLHEVSIMSTLQMSEHMVQLKGFSFDPPTLLMEYIGNGDLDLYLAKRDQEECKLPMFLRVRITLDVAKGMMFMNGLKPLMCHRDLSSNNVMLASYDVESEVVAKIIDFSTATAMIEPTLGVYFNEKKYCLAPEVLSEQSYNHKCDVYSFAILMWQLWTGRYAHHISESDVKQGVRPQIPFYQKSELHWKRYENLMKSCWDQNPDSRPEFKEIVIELKQIVEMMRKMMVEE